MFYYRFSSQWHGPYETREEAEKAARMLNKLPADYPLTIVSSDDINPRNIPAPRFGDIDRD